MTDWQVVFLGVMAASLAAMAVVQLLVAVALQRTIRQIDGTVRALQAEVRPLIDKANRMTEDAARVAALAVAQAERLDTILATMSIRVEETLGIVQRAIVEPVRQGAAVVAAFRAVAAAVRDWRTRGRHGHEDEDPLFVG